MRDNIANYFSKVNHHNPIIFNSILWVLSFFVLLFGFTPNNEPEKIDYIYTFSFLVTIGIPVLINFYILIPKFLKLEKYVLYIILFSANLTTFTQLNIWFFSHLIDYVFPEYYFISYHSNTKLITIFSVFLIVTTLIKLAEDWFYFNKKENQYLKLKNQQTEKELSVLRSRINPHFLFNSLNVIYALAIERKTEITQAIVNLSDILRYVIYDSNTKFVSLKDEIKLLENYIAFQKLRQHENDNISFSAKVKNKDYKICPMIFLPLVENSFKHGIKGDIMRTYVNIVLEQKMEVLSFYIENNFTDDTGSEKDKHSGLGLDHIKKNLDIVYPKQHELNINKTETKFTVSLKVFKNDN